MYNQIWELSGTPGASVYIYQPRFNMHLALALASIWCLYAYFRYSVNLETQSWDTIFLINMKYAQFLEISGNIKVFCSYETMELR